MTVGTGLRLRPAANADRDLLLAWRNRPEIIARGTHLRTIEPDEHARWFADALTSTRRLLLIVELDGEPIGQVHFQAVDAGNWSVSIYLLEPYTGRGLGTEALHTACAIAHQRGVATTWALIRDENERSTAAFRRVGFVAADDPAIEVPPGHHALRLDGVVAHA